MKITKIMYLKSIFIVLILYLGNNYAFCFAKNTLSSTIDYSTDTLPEYSVIDTCSIKYIDISKDVDFGYREGERTIDSIDVVVIHTNYYLGRDSFSAEGCIKQFKDYDVSPHYLITREGYIIKMVDECNVAWHAGISSIPNVERPSINACSIGIEIVNTRCSTIAEAQYDSLKKLVLNIMSRYKINYILGHRHIAPKRKDDPWNFDWNYFYDTMNWTKERFL